MYRDAGGQKGPDLQNIRQPVGRIRVAQDIIGHVANNRGNADQRPDHGEGKGTVPSCEEGDSADDHADENNHGTRLSNRWSGYGGLWIGAR